MSAISRAARLLRILGPYRMLRAAPQPLDPVYMSRGGVQAALRVLGAPQGWSYSDSGLKALLAAKPALDATAAVQAATLLHDLHYDPVGVAELGRMAAEQKVNWAAFHAKMAELDKFRTVPLFAPQQIKNLQD